MNKQSEKLTAEEFLTMCGVDCKVLGWVNRENIRIAMRKYADQQVEHATAELRHECEQLGKLLTTANGAIKYQKDKAEELRKELEKWEESTKDLVDQKGKLLKQLAEAQRQRDEAVKHLQGCIKVIRGTRSLPLLVAVIPGEKFLSSMAPGNIK